MDLRLISDGLELREDGIWYSSTSQPISYPSEGNERCFAVEDASFWFRHRNACIQALVAMFPPPGEGMLFDIGGGNGFVARGLADAGFQVAVVEPGPEGAINSRRRGLETVVCATTELARFRPESLPAVGLFDVVEHLEDDWKFLESLRSLLPRDGMLYATVPAYSWLWSGDDNLGGHFRRYTLRGLRATLESSGFEILHATYIFRFLPLPILLFKSLPYRIGLSRPRRTQAAVARDHAVQGGLRARSLKMLLRPEVENIKRKRVMRFGGSCLVAARRRLEARV